MESSSVQSRRNGAASTRTFEFSSTTQSKRTVTNRSPLLPTVFEAFLLAIYPSTLLLGSIFSLLEPHARNAPYNPRTQSHPSEVAPSYFAQKRNLFNVFFVKIGWFWTTIAFAIFMFMHPSTGPSMSLVLTPRRVQGLLRWVVATLWWTLVTQWFFGPPLIDRGFKLTGGQCELIRTEEGRQGMSETRELFTNAACKVAGGTWVGGYDISGHVFLLVLGSAFLWMELLPVILKHAGFREERSVLTGDGHIINAEKEAMSMGEEKDEGGDMAVNGGISPPVVVAALSWWMLLMTAAYFHTWFEKFSGLLVAFMAIGSIYFLPRTVPSLRSIIGMPGI